MVKKSSSSNPSTSPFQKGMRATARAIIIEDGKILMFERWRTTLTGKKLHYFSIPGGGIEREETPEDAVVRELYEEMLVSIEPIRLLVRQTSESRLTYYFLARIVSGTPTFNPESEEALFRAFGNNRYEVSWLPVENAVESVHHDDHRQIFELLPGLLDGTHPQPVDISSKNR